MNKKKQKKRKKWKLLEKKNLKKIPYPKNQNDKL